MERLREGTRHLGRLEYRHRHLGHRRRDRRDVDGLEVFLVQAGDRGLAGDGEDRNRIRHGRIQPGDHVGAGRTGRTETDADVPRCGPGEALRHVRSTLDVAGQYVANATVITHRRVERVDRGTGQAECRCCTFEFENLHCGIGRAHPGHLSCPCSRSGSPRGEQHRGTVPSDPVHHRRWRGPTPSAVPALRPSGSRRLLHAQPR